MTTTPARLQSIAIIGGGFSGLMTAVNVMRLARRTVRLTIINGQRPTGRGVAYSTRRAEHLLNVAARNMSAFPDIPDHFVNWLRTRTEYDTLPEHELREKFIPRLVYGDYLRSLMHHYLSATEFVDAEAVDMDERGVILGNGRVIEADRIVLASGNEAPAPLPGAEALADHPGWLGNPWLDWLGRLPASDGSIVLLGTGLTTVDSLITLRSLGWYGRVHAVSRHGWLPQSHFRGIEYPDFPPEGVDLAELGLERLVKLVEGHCNRLRDMGANPGIIVDKMRAHTQRIWQKLTLEERLSFAKHHAAKWNIIRHRIAPEIHAQITTMQLTGQLQVHAANIERVVAAGQRVEVQLSGGKTITGDLVINATGPQTRFTATSSVLLQNLLKRGLVSPDDMDMGLRITPGHTIVDGEGKLSPSLLAIGPLLRGTYWETIAVPELRGQARRVAETLLGHTDEPTIEQKVMMEYMI